MTQEPTDQLHAIRRGLAFIHHCYENGTRPLVSKIFDPDDLLPKTD